jgi:DNA-binding SARP family transcriptional activator
MLSIRLLGEQRVAVGGAPVAELRSPRTLGLLTFLILHAGAPQLRSHLAGLFWSDSTDAQARTNLRRELHRLRGALPDPDRHLDITVSSLCWREDAPADVDVIAFRTAADQAEAARAADDAKAFCEAAEHAVRHYGGDLLPAFYDDWVLAERDSLRRSCVTLLDDLLARLGEEQPDRALRHARRRVEVEPLEEAGYRQLMALEAEAGDRGAALRTFQRCISVLEQELGVGPSPATTAVHEQLLSRSSNDGSATPLQPTVRTEASPLVGRDSELATLHRLWGDASHRPLVALVAGEAGVGKTYVVQEFARRIGEHEAAVARARCFPAGGRLALAPVAEWLRTLAVGPAIQQLEEGTRAELARLVPDLAAHRAAAPDAATGDPSRAPLTDPWQRRRFFEALVQAVHALDDRVLLVLDDLQWSDQETLAWLEVLVNAPADQPLLVLATMRSEELHDNPPLVTFYRRLHASGLLRELELTPLSGDEVAQLAAAIGGESLSEEDARELHVRTGGFPLFVVESLRDGQLRSERIDAVLRDRLDKLSPGAADLAGLASTVGRDFSLELLSTAADLDDRALLDAVDELWRRRLLRQHASTTYDFAHDLLRDAAYAQLSPPQRQLLHRRVADALESLHVDDPEVVAAQLAEQYEQSGQPQRAIRYHALAAESATQVFALDDAVRHYRRALELLSHLPASVARDQRELELLQACLPLLTALEGYASPTLGTFVERAMALAEQSGRDEILVAAQVGYWGHLFVRGHITQALALTSKLVGQAEDHPAQAGQICVVHAGVSASAGRLRDSMHWFERVEGISQPGEQFLYYGFRVWVMAHGWRAHPLWLLGRSAEAADSAETALDLAEEFDHPYSLALALAYGAITYRLLGDAERSGELGRRVRRLCDRYGFAYYGDWGRILEGRSIGGAAGETLIREGIDRLRSAYASSRLPFWLAMLAEVLLASGRVTEAARVLTTARDWAEEHGDRWWLAAVLGLLASTHSGQEAQQLREQALAVAREQEARALRLRIEGDLAE